MRKRGYTAEERSQMARLLNHRLSHINCASCHDRRALFLQVRVTLTIEGRGGSRELSFSDHHLYCDECYGRGQLPGAQYLQVPLSSNVLNDHRFRPIERHALLKFFWTVAKDFSYAPPPARPAARPDVGVVCQNCGRYHPEVRSDWELDGRMCSDCGLPLIERVLDEEVVAVG